MLDLGLSVVLKLQLLYCRTVGNVGWVVRTREVVKVGALDGGSPMSRVKFKK